jgi:hypothetical protein
MDVYSGNAENVLKHLYPAEETILNIKIYLPQVIKNAIISLKHG